LGQQIRVPRAFSGFFSGSSLLSPFSGGKARSSAYICGDDLEISKKAAFLGRLRLLTNPTDFQVGFHFGKY
jgi:hypothetical protein